MEKKEGKLKFAVLTCVFFGFLFIAQIEAAVFVSWLSCLETGPLLAALLFAHNSLAATTVAAGMLFLASLINALPERFGRENEILKHPRLFSIFLAVLLLFGSVLHFSEMNGGLNLEVFSAILVLPVAAIEGYGTYLAALLGLCRRISASNMTKVYMVFLIGAVVETAIMCLAQHFTQYLVQYI